LLAGDLFVSRLIVGQLADFWPAGCFLADWLTFCELLHLFVSWLTFCKPASFLSADCLFASWLTFCQLVDFLLAGFLSAG
jgi:hypothetical protein